MEFHLVQPELPHVANSDICHCGIMQSLSTCTISLPGPSQHGSYERHTAEGPWLPKTLQGLQERGKESFRGSWQWRILGEGFTQGHCLRCHPSSSRSEPTALSWVLHSCRKARITQTVPAVKNLGVQECEKAGIPVLILKLPSMQSWREHLIHRHKHLQGLDIWCTIHCSFPFQYVGWPWLEPRTFPLLASLSFFFLLFLVSLWLPSLSFCVPLGSFSRVLVPS